MSKKQEAELKRIGERFRKQMEDLGLGVTITVPGREPAVVTEPPEKEKEPKNS